MKKALAKLMWLLLAGAGAWAYATLALSRGERLNSAYILVAALCTYAIGYRFYSKWLATRVLMLDDRRATPCEVHDDGKDYVRTNKWIVFGHHFAAISGPGPLVGPVLAAQFGYLPGTLWILIGVVLGGAVQDMVILFCSIRRDGKSLAQMIKEELGNPAGAIAVVAVVAILIVLLAVLALVVVNALGESPWGVFTVGATIPIAMLMGGYLRFWRVGRIREVTVIGVVLLLLAVWGGQYVYHQPALARFFSVGKEPIAWIVITYGLAASVLPVWLLLAPRDYLSTFMKLGTIFALGFGVLVVLPDLRMPAFTRFMDGSGPVVPGTVFPFCFITIACGAISGFHALVASGITPKIITRESYARPVGYGAMCLESLVAIMAMIAATTLQPGVYLSMNVDVGDLPVAAKVVATAEKITNEGFPVTATELTTLAAQVGEPSLVGKTGGAVTLAVGMAGIFAQVTHGRWLDLWYHFAIMFEALFILTTIDAGTRVGRYLLQDGLGHLWKPFRQTGHFGANVVASCAMVVGWGFFLIMGVRDPEGGVKALWPIFGISNQMLAAIALCLATTVILKITLQSRTSQRPLSPALALTTLVPLVWLLCVTFTAGVQKIGHSKPGIGFLAANRALQTQAPKLQDALAAAQAADDTAAITKAKKSLRLNHIKQFNNTVDAVATGIFMVLVTGIVVLSVREWVLLLGRRKPAVLCETEPVWLPDYAVNEARPLHVAGAAALALALAKELSGEAEMERAGKEAALCECRHNGDNCSADQQRAVARNREVQLTWKSPSEGSKGSSGAVKPGRQGNMKRIGLFGGSFDPVHLAHLLVAQAAREELGLERLFIIPAAHSPFKPDRQPSPVEQRLRLLRLALAGDTWCEIDEQELQRGGVSYTIDTARDYARRFPDAQRFYLIGADHLPQLPKWRAAEELARLVEFVAIPRPGQGEVPFPAPFRGRWLAGFPLGVSSSQIRARVKAGLPIDHLVPAFVAEAIRNNGLYL